MAKCTPLLWKHKPRSNGHLPIWLRLEGEGRTLYHSLGVAIHPRHWNEKKREVRSGHPQSAEINSLIQARLNDVEAERLRLLREGEAISAEAMKEAISPSVEPTSGCFLQHGRKFLAEVERRGNIRRYKKESAVLNKLERFAGSTITFESVTPALLREFESYLITELDNKASTVQSNMGILRAHFRRAIRDGLVSRESDPFVHYTPPKAEKPERHKLSIAELERIESLELDGGSLLARTCDIFLFATYCAGIRFGDVATMLVSNITEEEGHLRLSYRMGKTKKRATLRLIPQAEQIAMRYMKGKKESDFLFPLLDGYNLSTPRDLVNAISSQNTVANKHLKQIAVRANVQGTLSFHIARHSFSDFARKRGWDVYAISKALAHSSLSRTENYLAGFDQELVDDSLNNLFKAPE